VSASAIGPGTKQPTPCESEQRPRLSLVFPVFDEEHNITPLLEEAHRIAAEITPDFEVVLVDDGSRDNSARIIDLHSRRNPRIRVVRHATNGGYGAALRSGLREARGELIFFSDADLQFDLAELGKLLEHTSDFDIVAGYRAPRSDPWHRHAIAKVWGSVVQLLFGLRVRDIDCAFKVFRREVIEAIPIASLGAFVNTEILLRSCAAGYRIHQVPVSHRPRRHGRQTGARPRVILRAVMELSTLYRELRHSGLEDRTDGPRLLQTPPSLPEAAGSGWKTGWKEGAP
jgi:glycosyltransferase involved in cell wall biosynthesis